LAQFGPPIDVIWRTLPPSTVEIQSSSEPDRVEVNTTCFPSGEYEGVVSSRVEVEKTGIHGDGVRMRDIELPEIRIP
jgi:hypothetical protein